MRSSSRCLYFALFHNQLKVKPPRIAIATVIVLIVLLAVDFALLRSPFGGNDAAMLRLCALPMANLMVLGLYLSIVRSRRGEKYPFLLGFEVFGWAALAAFLYGCDAFPASLGRFYAVWKTGARRRKWQGSDCRPRAPGRADGAGHAAVRPVEVREPP